MAAPSGIVWGGTVGSGSYQARIGIYVKLTSTATQTTIHTEIWFWSKYSVSDSSNTFYYNDNATSATTSKGSVTVKTTVSSGSGWSTSNQVKLASYDETFTRGTSATTRNVAAKLTGIDVIGSTMTATTSYTIPALTSYAVKYNANGGTGAPGNQTKYYGKSLTLSSTKPTRTGYTFQGWATSANGSVVNQPGGTYTGNAAVTYYAVWKAITYTVAYNANGGSGQPSSQTKTYGVALTLSSTKPTRTGYTFQGWATSAGGSVAYAAGASYTNNAAVTLYAVWKANTYTVSYNANGGTGQPGNQTKTHGVNLTLSSTKPTRANYAFKGWATSAGGSVVYASGATYTGNAAITLYAVWELSYVKPAIFNFTASRCNSTGALDDTGSYAHIKFSWKTTNAVTAIAIEWASASGDTGSASVSASGTSGTVDEIIGGSFSADASYTVTARVADSGGDQESKLTLNGSKFVIDAKVGGDGVSFGKPAELGAAESLGGNGVADFAFDAKFNQPVYGNVLGLNRLPAIPEGAELNDYITTGAWAIYSNAVAATITCGGVLLGTDDSVPPARAGRFEVNSATGEGIRLEQWSYLRQRFIPYNMSNPTFEREITRGENNIWTYYEWWKSSLSPAAAQKVYKKAAITIGLSENVTLGVQNVYTKIPFNAVAQSTGDRLTLTENAVRIGKDIEYVKVSGQTVITAGNTAGLRHIRIQKYSGGTTSFSWLHRNLNASLTTPMILTPVIVPVKEGDLLFMVFYTGDTADRNVSGSAANGYQTYLTVEEL